MSSIAKCFICFLLIITTCAPNALAAEPFPLRPYYPEVAVISTSDLLAHYDQAKIVDIRSSFEFDVARINTAFLLPLTDKNFGEKLEKIRTKQDDVPLVFYCNGHTCAKSYQASQLALSLGFNHVFAYDGGIFDWISSAPDKATLMGETPARSDRIISESQFEKNVLDFETFTAQASQENAIVIDIRDPFQRELLPRIPGIRTISLDPLLDLVVSRIWTEKRLLFFDAVGKQIRWLQYFLESYGYFDYAFLRGGVQSIAADPGKCEPVIETNRSIISNQGMLLKLTNDNHLDNSDRKALSFLLANVKFNNYIVIDMTTAESTVGMGPHLLMHSVNKLAQRHYITRTTMEDNLIVQVDPRLAWKGIVGDETWQNKVKEFDSLTLHQGASQ